MKRLICVWLALVFLPVFSLAQEPQPQEPQAVETVQQEQSPLDRAEIYAPRTGKATLRKKASAKSDMLRKCKAGVIVEVLETGETFTKIKYKDTEGYILTSCLMLHSSEDEPIGKGVLTLEGRATGKATINIRNKPDKESRKVAVWKTGVEVDVYGEQDGWVYIQADGIRGWVMEEYLTVEKSGE